MDIAGRDAFRRIVSVYLERPAYRELVERINAASADMRVRLRVDAVHLLALNFSAMVAEPLAVARQTGPDGALLDQDVSRAIDQDLRKILEELPKEDYRTGSHDPDEPPSGVSAGTVLEQTGRLYRSLNISSWQLWGD